MKPDCKLIGEDGNIFNLLGIASKTLKANNLKQKADEMATKVYDSKSYMETLAIIFVLLPKPLMKTEH